MVSDFFLIHLLYFQKFSIFGVDWALHLHIDAREHQKTEKKKSFWKTDGFDHANVRGVFKGSLGGSKSPGPVENKCLEKILWADLWKLMTSSIWQIGP